MNPQDPPIPPPSAQPKRFFDVVPPGHITPSTTSRPTVVDRGVPQADPMMTANPTSAVPAAPELVASDEASEESQDLQQSEGAQPIAVSIGSPEPDSQNTHDAPDQTIVPATSETEPQKQLTAETPPSLADIEPEEPAVPPTPEPTQPEPSATGQKDAPTPPAPHPGAQLSASSLLELPAHADGGMVVVHHRGPHPKVMIIALILAAAVLLLVVLDLLLDAGIIKNSLSWHTHFLGTN